MTHHIDQPAGQPDEIQPVQEVPGATSMTHAQINAAYDRGEVRPFSRGLGYLIHHAGTWWIHHTTGWLRADPTLNTILDAEAARLEGRANQIRDAVIHAVVNEQLDKDGRHCEPNQP